MHHGPELVVALLVAVAACGPSKPPPGDPVVSHAAPDAGPPPPLAEGCPAQWEGTPGASCDPAGPGGCTYAEGSCWCGVPMPCSGAALPDDWGADIPPTWQCTPTPPAIREDGCPGQMPSGACAQHGQRCTYGSCCVHFYECRSGTWENTGGECPP